MSRPGIVVIPLLLLFFLLLLSSTDAGGDVLNRTMCYCGTRDYDRPDHAYVYHMTYYNAHLARAFPLRWSCHDTDRDPFDMPGCWRIRNDDQKHCDRFDRTPEEPPRRKWRHRQHRFCYDLEFEGEDHYGFDGQKRDVPTRRARLELKDAIRAVCEPLCQEEHGLPMSPGEHDVFSRLDSMTDLDDMCDGCA